MKIFLIAILLAILIVMAAVVIGRRMARSRGAINANLAQLTGQPVPVQAALRPVPPPTEEVFALASSGNKIGAIKLYREQTGLDLRTAKDVIDRLTSGNLNFLDGSLPAGNVASMPTIDDIRGHLRTGNKIAAIKLYRQLYGSDLRTAKAAVEQLELGHELPLPTSNIPYGQILQGSDSLDPEAILDYVRRDNKIAAIKLYRQLTGLDLRTAKDTIDQLERAMFLQEITSNMSALQPIRQRLAEGDRAAAIRLYRERTGADPAEAESVISRLQQTINSI